MRRLLIALAIAAGAAQPAYTAVGALAVVFQKNECREIADGAGGRTKMCELKLKPRKMTVEFVTREQFNAMKDVPPDAVGYTNFGKTPCEIVLPIDGAVLQSYPKSADQRVYWAGENTDMGAYLAHEILHCYAGAWHPSYYPGLAFRDSIETRRRSDALPLKPVHPGED